ncbi:MAG: GAF domain-containing protein [Acidobacteria bacterium]|nr:GAF domain-containing protein [Acidobacteriota bacterium]
MRLPVDSLQVLTEASEVVANHPLSLDELLRALAELVRKVADYQLFAVLLAEANGDLAIRYSIGYRPELAERLRVRRGEGITGDAAKRRRTVIVGDVRKDRRYLMAVEAVRSEIAVPLVARGKLVGVIDLQSARPAAFDEDSRNVLELIASRFSLAIDAALLFEQSMRQNATLKTLADAAQEFSTILALDELLHKISGLVRQLARYDAFSIYLLEGQSLQHYFGVRFDERVQWQSMPLGEGIVGAAGADRKTILARDTSRDPRYVQAVEGIRSEVAVPLILKDAVIGVLDLESERLAAFDEEHVQALELLAPQVAAAIDNARLYEQLAREQARLRQDLTAARHLQKLLLPTGFPRFEGLEVAARNVSAVEVSGDFYDFFEQDGERFMLINGDVTGKGAAAALYAALASGLLQSLTAKFLEPKALLEALNQGLLARPLDARYLVAIVACWVPAERRLSVASSGQPRPAVRRGGKAEFLRIGGTPLGMIDPGVYDEVSLELAPGDVFVTASDGLHETEDAAGRQYGEQRLGELLESLPDASARELLDAIFEDARTYGGMESPPDDRTVVVLRAL